MSRLQVSRDLSVSRKSVAFTFLVLALAAVYILVPIWWLIVSSTKSNSGLFTSNGFWFGDLRLWENVQNVFAASDGQFSRWLLNSLFYSIVGGAVATLVGAACGYGLAMYEFRGRGIVFGMIIAGILVPNTLLTVPLYLLFSSVGLVNTIWAVLLPSMVSPFAVYLARVYAGAFVPSELLEAARIDGASEPRMFRSIGVRLMAPGLVTIFLFSMVGIWNNFFLPLIMLSDSKLFPVTLGLYGWYSTEFKSTYDIVLMGSVISTLPLVLAFFVLQRYWQSGLSAGSVKA